MPRSIPNSAPVTVPKLEETLYALTVDGLKWYATALGGLGRTPLKKADLVDKISAVLLDPRELKQIYGKLSASEQAAIAEAAYKYNGLYKVELIEARYPGVKTPSTERRLYPGYGYSYGAKKELKEATPFDLFLYYAKYDYDHAPGWYIPSDIVRLLRTFVTAPTPQKMKSYEELPPFNTLHKPFGDTEDEYYVSRCEEVIFHDVAATLTLIDQGKINVGTATKLPTLPGLRLLKERLLVGDYFAEQEYNRADDAIRTLALVAITEAASWAAPTGTGGKLQLTRRGQAIISGTIGAEEVKEAWEQWVKAGFVDELSRISTIKGQKSSEVRLSKPAGRRDKLVTAMRALPPGRWVSFDEFLRYMRAEDLMPRIELNQWSGLYVISSYYGNLGEASKYWDVVTGSYLRAVVWEYAATLGLLEIAYTLPENANHNFGHVYGLEDEPYLSRYDGLLAIQLTALGEYALGITTEYTPTLDGKESQAGEAAKAPLLKVLPNMDVVVTDPHRMLPNERAFLEKITSAQSQHVYRLNRDTLLEAAQNGITPQQALTFLAVRNGVSEETLPNTVLTFFADLEKRLSLLRDAGKMLVLESDDQYILAELSTAPTLKGKTQMATIGKKSVLLVPEEYEQTVRKQIKKMGYAPRKVIKNNDSD
jgi:hypothetical protein